MKYYLSGPMSGIKDFNSHAFKMGEALLRSEGHQVWSPRENDVKKYGEIKSRRGNPDDIPEFNEDEVATDDMLAVIHSQGIAMLPGWEYSGGCLSEWALAKWKRKKFRYISQEELDRFEKCLGKLRPAI